MKINIGCGNDIRKGWVNLDYAALPGVDVVHDLNAVPLPFDSGTADEINAQDVFEHVDYIPLTRDLFRILRPGGTLSIRVPHYSSANSYIDPTHTHQFSIRTFDFFVSSLEERRNYYFDFAFSEKVSAHITFLRHPLVYNHLVEIFVNLSDRTRKYYELTLLCGLFPAMNVCVRLRK